MLLNGDHIIPEITPHVGLYSDDGCSDQRERRRKRYGF